MNEVQVHFAALEVALLKAQMFEAAQALKEWAEEWLDTDELEDELEELLDDA